MQPIVDMSVRLEVLGLVRVEGMKSSAELPTLERVVAQESRKENKPSLATVAGSLHSMASIEVLRNLFGDVAVGMRMTEGIHVSMLLIREPVA